MVTVEKLLKMSHVLSGSSVATVESNVPSQVLLWSSVFLWSADQQLMFRWTQRFWFQKNVSCILRPGGQTTCFFLICLWSYDTFFVVPVLPWQQEHHPLFWMVLSEWSCFCKKHWSKSTCSVVSPLWIWLMAMWPTEEKLVFFVWCLKSQILFTFVTDPLPYFHDLWTLEGWDDVEEPPQVLFSSSWPSSSHASCCLWSYVAGSVTTTSPFNNPEPGPDTWNLLSKKTSTPLLEQNVDHCQEAWMDRSETVL